ncbi:hypothetical protein TELCIR_23497 [Teladorsagia circumcincta]|uniref:Uncharacterized protein n=1 Tax=Teladorsagia circumcincta TaxID=45464 RepID=A0A2G9TCK9_TELCI|nr:hypothetical protein TELCIR_23497 [Teladorsagia circumcincta]
MNWHEELSRGKPVLELSGPFWRLCCCRQSTSALERAFTRLSSQVAQCEANRNIGHCRLHPTKAPTQLYRQIRHELNEFDCICAMLLAYG